MALSPEKIAELKSACKTVKKRPMKFFYCLAGEDGDPTLIIGKNISNEVKALKKSAKKKKFVKGTVAREDNTLQFVTETPTAAKFDKNLKAVFGASIPDLKRAAIKGPGEARAPEAAGGRSSEIPDVAPPPMATDMLPEFVQPFLEFPPGDVDAGFVRSLNTAAGRSGLLRGAKLAAKRGARTGIADCLITLQDPEPTSLLVDSQIVTLTEWMRKCGVMKTDCKPKMAGGGGGGMAPPPPAGGMAPPPPSLGEIVDEVKKKVKKVLGGEPEVYPEGDLDDRFVLSLNSRAGKPRLIKGVNLAFSRGMSKEEAPVAFAHLLSPREDTFPNEFNGIVAKVLNKYGVTRKDCQ